VNELEESLSGPKPLLERLNVKAEESLELEILEVNLDTRSFKVLSNEFQEGSIISSNDLCW
jgi:hypothetical protein